MRPNSFHGHSTVSNRQGCWQLARRSKAWALLALGLLGALGARLFQVQVVRHRTYQEAARRSEGRTWPIPAPRGNIYDRNGNPLALNLKLYSVAADPKEIEKPGQVAARLAPLLRLPAGGVLAKLRPAGRSRYALLRTTVDERVADAIRGLNYRGLMVTPRWKRAYPHSRSAAALLGFVGTDMRGLGGAEAALDTKLAGADGQTVVVLDGRMPRSRSQVPGRSIVIKDMVPGSSVVLTVDLEIQVIAEEALAKAVEAADARGGTAIVMDPASGEILALATQPGFDPNDFKNYHQSSYTVPAVVSPYEPGSTFKVITACAAMEEGVMSRGETVNCIGSRAVGRRKISCALHDGRRAHGSVNLDEMVIKSCNVGMGTVGLALGAQRLHRWAARLGFGKKTGIELAAESAGMLAPPETWSQVQVVNVGFGQGVSVTALQLLTAYCAVANGGRVVSPHVVKMVLSPSGLLDERASNAGRQVLSPQTCERMKAALEKVVVEGTGKRARIPGRRVAGKTGTAQKPTPEAGYRSGRYIGSFVGFAPVERPRLGVLVAIDEPRSSYYGGVVAAPAFREICQRALTYLQVPPDEAPGGRLIACAGAELTTRPH